MREMRSARSRWKGDDRLQHDDEGGARAGMVAPDEKTYPISRIGEGAEGAAWDTAMRYWRPALRRGAFFDREVK